MKGDFSGDPQADTGGGGERVALYVIDVEREQREFMGAPESRIGFVASPIESRQRFGDGMWVGQECHSWLSSRLEGPFYQIARGRGP